MLDFLGIGAQKAGTTWIHHHLEQHPDICFPHGKEIHFWDWHRDRGVAWYTGLFSHNPGKKQGEITPAYAFQDIDTIRQIHAINPKLRLIFSARNPIDRAWSSAKMALQRAEMTLEEASDQWFLDHFHSRGSLNRGDYVRCLSNWLSVFPAEQLLVVHYDDIATNPHKVLEQCSNHIGVNPAFFRKMPLPQQKRVNEGISGTIRPSLLPALHALYDEKIRTFARMMQQLEQV